MTEDYLLMLVAKKYKLTKQEILSKTRRADVVRARSLYWHLLRHVADWSYPRIGRITGHDHTTVSYGVAKFDAESPTSKQEYKKIHLDMVKYIHERLMAKRDKKKAAKTVILKPDGTWEEKGE